MKLYRIRRKDNGKFFTGWVAPWSPRWHGTITWSDDGTFFKKIDTVIDHIKLMCSTWHLRTIIIGGKTHHCYRNEKKNRVIDRFDKRKLKKYEIVVSNVTLRGEEVIAAEDIIK